MVRMVFVEKKAPYAVEARALAEEFSSYLGIGHDLRVRILIRYDMENVEDEIYEKAKYSVFSEPPVDILHEEEFPRKKGDFSFQVEYLPGQFDQRADSAVQCLEFLGAAGKIAIKTAVVYCLSGELTPGELKKIQDYVINPVDSGLAAEEKPGTLLTEYEEPADIEVLKDFTARDEISLKELYGSLGLAMTFKDFLHIQNYFKNIEMREPTMTEIKVLDTYWSDHCRHTTFLTGLKKVSFEKGFYSGPIRKSYTRYLKTRKSLKNYEKPVTLMDVALMGMKALKEKGKLKDEEESDEINACSVVVPVEIEEDGKKREEEWLVMFKNETHNHPTEIEPFGGAATCLGGAIRDPLSGRAYVYQAMRVTGAADPTVPLAETIKGKLPQKKLVREAARGYSSYGNQVGLATGLVREIYHPGYAAKRMEIGAVVAAAPRKNVVRSKAEPGDVVILLGGRTGRDGCGGATGSSKVHTEASLTSCGAEVQKGNAPTERKLQRLFRRREASLLIKVCNDFGAGGVSVAIGELADGLKINLDLVPRKYAGLDGTELAISESQERMAVVVSPENRDSFLSLAAEENLEATPVAEVTEEPRLVMLWRGKKIVDISREFLNTNGAFTETEVLVGAPSADSYFRTPVSVYDFEEEWLSSLADLNECSEKGLVEMFDSSIGAGTVLMPYGGKYQETPEQVMAAKLPLLKGETDTVTLMSYGFDPRISSWSPYHGAVYAVTDSIARIVAAGGDMNRIRFTFQEYFKRMTEDPLRWGEPLAALLGGFEAQMGFGLPSIGGKDSMSGTFEAMDVPPTLVSFAVAVGKKQEIISSELKKAGNVIVKFTVEVDKYDLPDYGKAKKLYSAVSKAIQNGVIVSAYALGEGGIAPALSKMAFGNRLGVKLSDGHLPEEFFLSETGNILAEVDPKRLSELKVPYMVFGTVTRKPCISFGKKSIPLEKAYEAYSKTLEQVFPTRSGEETYEEVNIKPYKKGRVFVCRHRVARPGVFIPVFPGSNCEYDSARAFERAGAEVNVRVFRNLSAGDIRESVEEFASAIREAQIVMFPGGFSAGDEPDGSAKFFATAFRNELLKEAIDDLLSKRDGLVLGICNGFQALVKLGLLPEGRVTDTRDEDSPTLTFNTIGRHISRMVCTKVMSDLSPWLMLTKPGEVYINPASHGEGRFVAPRKVLKELEERGQIATCYSDPAGCVSMDEAWNVNGSFLAIEGITSRDGRVYGKMAHAERQGPGVAVNITGKQDMKLFEAGVKYFL
ncbi:MAG: phosphoribosylformylglycinamidine synthase [Lachnospiraceae bacterium]|nr:phosphoribosylformylglycinamidine synthase [Lachnospiraceae bacterium]